MTHPRSVGLLDDPTAPGLSHSVLDRWGAVVGQHPTNLAISGTGSSYTFAEADRAADGVAIGLADQLGDDSNPVAIYCGHTADAVIAILGVVKAGRVVVLLDPHLPSGRLQQIVNLAGITVCVADESNATAAAALGGVTTLVRLAALLAKPEPTARGADGQPSPAAESPGLVTPAAGGRQPVGIVFTSGSTGQPKGVIQTHDQLLNDVLTHGQCFRLSPDDRVAMVLPFGFAAGFSLLWGALLNGAGVWSFDPRDGGTRGLISWITQNRLTTLQCTPHLLRSLSGAMTPGMSLDSLRLVSTVGEAVHGSDVEAIRPHLPSVASFFNWTGSSEIGMLSLHEIRGGDPVPAGAVPAGRLVPNREIRLVQQEDRSPVPDGSTGEIEVISDFMSGGYWNDDAGNATRFGTDADGRRICRQGDLGRFDEDGNLILLGRADAVVKVRGYLVDTSEIESVLTGFDGVKEAVVIAAVEAPSPTRLVAYVAQETHLRTESPAALRRRLRARLPEYMVPAHIVQLSELPRNERGKVDRLALPKPEAASPSAPPTTQWELAVADLWSEVLGLDSVGLDDDFMAMGGDSLSAEEMLTLAHERFNVALLSTDLLEAPTLREFARRVTLGSSSLPSHPDVATLQSGSVRPPLFCFAGSGALALTFLPLSRHFADRSVHAFQAHGLERRAIPDWSVEATARRFLEVIRVIQPHGPYNLVGHSFGGLVAMEIASQLLAADEEVELVTLFDTYLPQSTGRTPEAVVQPFDDETPAHNLLRPVREFAQQQLRRVFPHGLPAARQWTQQARAYLAGVVPFEGQLQFDAFFDHGIVIGRRYRPKPLAARTLLVLADDNPDGIEPWQDLLTGPVSHLTVTCEHSSLLREPHATGLAQAILSELGRA